MRVLFAGAGSLFGLEDIKQKCASKNLSADFIENSFMSEQLSDADKQYVLISDSLKYDEYDIILPANEYWLSKCIEKNVANISCRAQKASRDKVYFSECLEKNHIPHCKQLNIDELDKTSGNIIIKPRYAYSGKGVSVFSPNSTQSLTNCIEFAKSGINKTKSIIKVSDNDVTFWQYEEGIEYSADVFFDNGSINVIRICEKVIKIVNYRPCNLGYRLINSTPALLSALSSWCNALYNKNDISFAQFDFIKRYEDNEYIPIDYSSRVGGGVRSLLLQLKENPYSGALVHKSYSIQEGVTQINLLSKKSGHIVCDDYQNEGFTCYKYKRQGDYISDDITGGSNRLADFVCKTLSRDEFERIAQIGLQGDKYVS